MKHVKFNLINSVDLMAMEFEPVKWIVPGYVPEGFSVLAGRQKLGKTWLAIDFAVAVATGGAAMGSIGCEQGDVLYIDMENGSRRIQSRIDALFPNKRNRPNLSRLDWTTEALALDKGLLVALEDWRLTTKTPRLVVIDVLQRIKPAARPNQNSYESDYVIWAPLQKWATENRIAVVGLHHTKKGGADDPLEALSGSNGLSACADTTLVLDRDGNGVTLYVRGRDVEERESALTFLGGIWTLKGDAAEVRRSDERSSIAVTLKEATEPMGPTDLANVTGMPNGNIRKLLFTMAKKGEVQKAGRGQYIHPENQHLITVPRDPGNNGNKVTKGKEAA
ncbi:AAA family ATPase [Sinorhizobium fredii]|uniref:AAA family ATPase n=1 Tax=Rhizobium fredii TaxID=380 RepID=UPI0004AEC02B|nr:AAA family ATPase [Sinorhizobium fredii]